MSQDHHNHTLCSLPCYALVTLASSCEEYMQVVDSITIAAADQHKHQQRLQRHWVVQSMLNTALQRFPWNPCSAGQQHLLCPLLARFLQNGLPQRLPSGSLELALSLHGRAEQSGPWVDRQHVAVQDRAPMDADTAAAHVAM